jgi:dipeptidyl aminopeptidase/acylaminoacyl peptidase
MADSCTGISFKWQPVAAKSWLLMNTFFKSMLSILLLSQAVPDGFGQAQQKVTTQDYEKWHTLFGGNLSPDGMWSSYKLRYENNIDSCFIYGIKSGYKYFYSGATNIEFSPSSKFAVINFHDSSIAIQDLQNELSKKICGVSKHQFLPQGLFLAVLKSQTDYSELCIYDSTAHVIHTIKNAVDFELNSNGKLAVIEESGIYTYDSRNNFKKTMVISGRAASYSNMIWNKSGNVLAFLHKIAGEFKLATYNSITNERKAFGNEKLDGMCISDKMQTPIILSDDGTRLFFYFSAPETIDNENELVEVWDSSSKLVYPALKNYGKHEKIPKIAVWNTNNDDVNLIGTDQLPKAFLTTDRKHVLSYSYLANEPQYEMIAPVNIYISSIESTVKTLLLEKQSISGYNIGSSPSGRFIHYFKESNWWVYDLETKEHISLTGNVNGSFIDNDIDYPGKQEGYNSPGWTADSKFLIVYDKYDIWLLSPDAKTQQRITRGAEKTMTFRICEYLYQTNESIGSADFAGNIYDLVNGLLLSATGQDKATGYFKWNLTGTLDKIAYGNCKYSCLRKSADSKKYTFIKESFETPPALYYAKAHISKPATVFQSNPHSTNFLRGFSRLITYKTESGKELQGALFYPAGFENGKKYPMVVYIYSRESLKVHDYSNPTMYNPIGFTTSNYTNDGYLVFMPDIKYDIGQPGNSALECVDAAVKKVAEMGIVEQNHIGLIGHSFGGYEVCHLLTRTSMFAAAVAGAAVTDLISSYLSVNTGNGMKMDWRFETQQYRMGTTPFNDLQGYLENTTVTNASKITTPLLHWAGKEDTQCDWRQGSELHLAMRRLNKPNIFLAYPNQGHILSNTVAQSDLTKRTKNWFDHYLKGKLFPADGSTP